MKKCKRCHQKKSLDSFYKHKKMSDGYLNFCKECKKNEQSKRTKIYQKDPEWQKKERERCRDRNIRLNYAQKYKPSDDKKREYVGRWQLKNPEKRKAHIAVGNAIRAGKLVRKPCEKCSSTKNIHAHHEDYSKPLDVRWLCAACHGKEHRIDSLLPP